MLRLPFVVLFLVASTPLALAGGGDGQESDQDPPGATDVPGTGVPTEQESVEGGPGIAYGTVLAVGMLAFVAAFGFAAWRYAKRPPGP